MTKHQKTMLLILLFVALGVVTYFIVKKQKNGKAPAKGFFGTLGAVLGGSSGDVSETVKPHSGNVTPESTDSEFFTSLGYGTDYQSMFSAKDKAIVRDYIENWTRKGRIATPSDSIYNDLIRINGYSNMFPNLKK